VNEREIQMEDDDKKKHFQNALSNYSGVMSIIDRYDDEVVHDYNVPVPDNWIDDPLLLLGEYLDVLDIPEGMKDAFRANTVELVERYGVEDVWKTRCRFAAEIEFIINF